MLQCLRLALSLFRVSPQFGLVVASIYPIIALVLVFALVIVVHELGHMLAALLSRVDVTDFALGLGPPLASKKIGGIRYHLCALPLGGFVKISGMEPGEPESPPARGSYRDKHPLIKTLILVAGALMNFFLGVILIFSLAFIGFPKEVVLIRGVVPGGPAHQAGFKPGDIVESINGKRVKDELSLRSAILSAQKKSLTFLVQRRGEKLELTVSPRSFQYTNEEGKLVPYNEGRPSIGVIHSMEVMTTGKIAVVVPNSEAAKAGIKPGDELLEVNGQDIVIGTDLYFILMESQKTKQPVSVTLKRNNLTYKAQIPGTTTINTLGILFENETEKLPFNETVVRALNSVYTTTILFIRNLKLLGTKEGVKLLSGPVAIGSIIAQSAKSSLYTLIQITMVITINLGIINLLPIPPLDGGRVFFVLLEMVGLNIQERKRQYADIVGMALLLSLIALLTMRDILGLIRLSF